MGTWCAGERLCAVRELSKSTDNFKPSRRVEGKKGSSGVIRDSQVNRECQGSENTDFHVHARRSEGGREAACTDLPTQNWRRYSASGKLDIHQFGVGLLFEPRTSVFSFYA